MIMRPGQQQLLLPVSPLFMWGSLIVALLINMVPLGRAAWTPDLLALVIVFWSVHQPARIGIGAAFVFGLLMDVHQAAMLGQHALSYTTLGFFAIMIHRRLLWFPVISQALQVLPLFALVAPDRTRDPHDRRRRVPGMVAADRAGDRSGSVAAGQRGVAGTSAPDAGTGCQPAALNVARPQASRTSCRFAFPLPGAARPLRAAVRGAPPEAGGVRCLWLLPLFRRPKLTLS